MVALVAIAAVLGLLAWLWLRSRGQQIDDDSFTLKMRAMEQIKPVTEAVYGGLDPPTEAVQSAAADPRTRNTLFEFLLFHQRLNAYPSQYRTAEAFAESALVQWLMHPNELGGAPEKIELVGEVREPGPETIMARRDRWFVFRFREAGDGEWMAGVVGPSSGPPVEQFPDAEVVWSMFRPMESASPEEHVHAVRELAAKSGGGA